MDNRHPNVVIANIDVTRDAWYSRGKINENGMDIYKLANRAFEPRDGNVNLYSSQAQIYPDLTDLEAFALRQHGSERLLADHHEIGQNTFLDGNLFADAREDLGVAKDVMFHIGGLYRHSPDNHESVAASFGCFGVVSSNQVFSQPEHAQGVIDAEVFSEWEVSNSQYNAFIQKMKDIYWSTASGSRKYLFLIQKRPNYQRYREITIEND